MNQTYGPPELVAALTVAFVQQHRRPRPVAGHIPAYRLPALRSHILNYDKYKIKPSGLGDLFDPLDLGSLIPIPYF
jgi:hypothetical protein